MQIIKFGGSVLNSADQVKRLNKYLTEQTENYILVVSAFNSMTNILSQYVKNNFDSKILEKFFSYHNDICKELGIEIDLTLFEKDIRNLNTDKDFNECSDYIISYGEKLSQRILYEYFSKSNDLKALDAKDFIITDESFGKANINLEMTRNKLTSLNTNSNYIIQGFVAASLTGKTTTLGREGSDYSATLIGAQINASKVTLIKDIDSVFHCSPKICQSPKPVHKMSYEDALVLSRLGGQVLHHKCITPLKTSKTPLFIHSLDSDKGTLISENDTSCDEFLICTRTQQSQVQIHFEQPGNHYIHEVFSKLAIRPEYISLKSHEIEFLIDESIGGTMLGSLEESLKSKILDSLPDLANLVIRPELNLVTFIRKDIANGNAITELKERYLENIKIEKLENLYPNCISVLMDNDNYQIFLSKL